MKRLAGFVIFKTKAKWIGPREDDPKSQQVLGRIVTYTSEASFYEADPRHAEILLEAMRLVEAKSLSSPGTKDEYKEEGELLHGEDHTAYRAMAAQASYLALDRPDLQFAAKEE